MKYLSFHWVTDGHGRRRDGVQCHTGGEELTVCTEEVGVGRQVVQRE